jgi:hypothetical protein
MTSITTVLAVYAQVYAAAGGSCLLQRRMLVLTRTCACVHPSCRPFPKQADRIEIEIFNGEFHILLAAMQHFHTHG